MELRLGIAEQLVENMEVPLCGLLGGDTRLLKQIYSATETWWINK